MANWSRKKILRLAKGFTGRSKNCFGLALRKTHRAAQYAYRDRRNKKRTVRREWIGTINAAVREHGVSYSKFAFGLGKCSNIELDRKILDNLAKFEPYSFKAVVDEVKVQANFKEVLDRKPMVNTVTAISYADAMSKGLITPRKRLEEIQHIIEEVEKPDIYGLRFPEKHAKTDADYMRLSMIEEDDKFREE
jgi:large subunit ribosomal protein L20